MRAELKNLDLMEWLTETDRLSVELFFIGGGECGGELSVLSNAWGWHILVELVVRWWRCLMDSPGIVKLRVR